MHTKLAAFPKTSDLYWVAAFLYFGLTPMHSKAETKVAKAGNPAGVEVQVTPEMLGAGVVSSGAVLPPIPVITGNRQTPVASWGKLP